MALNIAYEAPDNYNGGATPARRPIDLVHLARQTMGDKSLEIEVLQMFARQARQLSRDIAEANADTAIEAAHRLKGAASAVGAFIVSSAADRIEAEGVDAGRLAELNAAVIAAENFICSLTR